MRYYKRTPDALVVKWISSLSSEQMLGVRIPPRAPNRKNPEQSGFFLFGARRAGVATERDWSSESCDHQSVTRICGRIPVNYCVMQKIRYNAFTL